MPCWCKWRTRCSAPETKLHYQCNVYCTLFCLDISRHKGKSYKITINWGMHV
jgi:hypothetical protein